MDTASTETESRPASPSTTPAEPAVEAPAAPESVGNASESAPEADLACVAATELTVADEQRNALKRELERIRQQRVEIEAREKEITQELQAYDAVLNGEALRQITETLQQLNRALAHSAMAGLFAPNPSRINTRSTRASYLSSDGAVAGKRRSSATLGGAAADAGDAVAHPMPHKKPRPSSGKTHPVPSTVWRVVVWHVPTQTCAVYPSLSTVFEELDVPAREHDRIQYFLVRKSKGQAYPIMGGGEQYFAAFEHKAPPSWAGIPSALMAPRMDGMPDGRFPGLAIGSHLESRGPVAPPPADGGLWEDEAAGRDEDGLAPSIASAAASVTDAVPDGEGASAAALTNEQP